METEISETGRQGAKVKQGETGTNRRVSDVTEIEWTWNGESIVGWAEWNRLCQRFISNPVSNSGSQYHTSNVFNFHEMLLMSLPSVT